MSASADPLLDTMSKNKDIPRLEDLLRHFLQNGVVVSGTSEAWKDPVLSGEAMSSYSLMDHKLLDSLDPERQVVYRLRMAAAHSTNPEVRKLRHLPDARGREADSHDMTVKRLKNQWMVLMWDRTVAVPQPPTEIDPDDLYCNTVAACCMAVVHGAASAPNSIADFWNSCVKALNAHCTEGRVPLVATASLAYATDCLIERGTDQNSQPLERPNNDLTKFVPALGECWACLCAHINSDVASATDYVLDHNLSLAKLLSACSDDSINEEVADTLARRFKFEFDERCHECTKLPVKAPTLPDDLDSTTDETLFYGSDSGKRAHTKLKFIREVLLNKADPVKPKDDSIPMSYFDENHRKGLFISTNKVLCDTFQQSDHPQDAFVVDLMCIHGSQSAWKNRLIKRWTTALLCTCCSTTCKFRTDMIPSLSARITTQTMEESECKYLDTEVHWADGTVTNHCAARDIIHLLQ